MGRFFIFSSFLEDFRTANKVRVSEVHMTCKKSRHQEEIHQKKKSQALRKEFWQKRTLSDSFNELSIRNRSVRKFDNDQPHVSVADPDLELRKGARFFLDVETKLICEYCLPCRLFFLLRSLYYLFIFFFGQKKGGPGPSPRSATASLTHLYKIPPVISWYPFRLKAIFNK